MNLFELFVKIGVDDQASGKLKDLGGKLGNGLKTAANIGTAAVGAAAAGITALTTAAVNNYAEYEQLVGGVDTLFKDASQKVQQYAANAYKTAGMSANDYMANATAFSASLISSLGGDTEKAAEYANRAMVSMSDNANKMGTNIDSIVQTYQSLARGNFAMLDNLKLGYGGTKAELERLIKDAASYTDIQKEMGITVDASSTSFDNIVNAIAVVQGKLGIAGATAQEAGTTIEGSVNSMKAAWDNLITGVADKNADLEGLIGDFITTIVGDGTESNLGVLGNIMPAVKSALNGASNLVSEMIPIIVQEIPAIINDNLPILTEAAVSIIQSLVDGISQNQEMLFETVFGVITYLAESFITMLPQIIELGLDLIVSLADGIAESLPELIPTIVDVVIQIVETLIDNVDMLVDAAIEIMIALADGIIDALPKLIEKVPIIINKLIEAYVNNAPKMIEASLKIILSLAKGLITSIPELIKAIPQIVTAIVKGFTSYMSQIKDIGKNIVNGVWEGIQAMASWIGDKVTSFFSGIVDGVKGILGIASPSKVFASIGGYMAEGLGEGWDDKFVKIKNDINKSMRFDDASIGINASIRKIGMGTNGSNFGGVSVVQNIYSEAKTAADLMQEAIYQQERAVLIGV